MSESDHECDGLLGSDNAIFSQTLRPIRCGIEEKRFPWPEIWPWKRLESVTAKYVVLLDRLRQRANPLSLASLNPKP